MNQSTPSDRLVDATGTPQDAPLDQPAHTPGATPAPAAAPAPACAPRRGFAGFPALMTGLPMLATGLALLTHQWVFWLLIPAVMMLTRGGCAGRRR